jgi:hypothetical protein
VTADRIRKLFPAALDGELSDSRSKQFEQALVENPALAAEFKAYSRLVSQLATMRQLEVPAGFAERVMARVRELPIEEPGLLQRLGRLFAAGRSRRLSFELAAAAASIALVFVAISSYDASPPNESESIETVKYSATREGKAVATDYSQFSRADSKKAGALSPAAEAPARNLRVAPAPAPPATPSAYRTISYGTVDDDLVRPDEPTLNRANNFFVLGRNAARRAVSRRSAPNYPAEEITSRIDEPSLPVAFEADSEDIAEEREEAEGLQGSTLGEVVAFRTKQENRAAKSVVAPRSLGSSRAGSGAGMIVGRRAPQAAPAAAPAASAAPAAVATVALAAPEPAPAPQPAVTMAISEIFIHGTNSELLLTNENIMQAIQYLKDNPSVKVGVGVYLARRTANGGLILAPSAEHTSLVKNLFSTNSIAPEQARFSGLNASANLPGELIGTIIIFKRF